MENSELITKALNYIKSEAGKSEITIDDVAKKAVFSTDYFNRIFFAHTGFNVMEYVRFRRMKKATQLLRFSEKDLLDIALECGYGAHESFSRAFKNQYGITPSEYRKKYEKAEAVYGDFFNETVGARLLYEFKCFKIADTDEILDYMLELDALRYGYAAVCFRVNGGVALYNGEDFKEGFIWFTEWDGRFEGDIICDNWKKISEYLKTFSDERFNMKIYTLADDALIKSELAEYGFDVHSIKRNQTTVYTGAPYELSAPEGITMRKLMYDDFAIIKNYFDVRYGDDGARLKHLKYELHQRDVLGNSEHSVFMFGIFKDSSLIGISDGALQRTNGFVINNCVSTSMYAEFEREEIYRYAFKFVTNAALEKGALPVDSTQTFDTEEKYRSGRFNSTDLGYRNVVDDCRIK